MSFHVAYVVKSSCEHNSLCLFEIPKTKIGQPATPLRINQRALSHLSNHSKASACILASNCIYRLQSNEPSPFKSFQVRDSIGLIRVISVIRGLNQRFIFFSYTSIHSSGVIFDASSPIRSYGISSGFLYLRQLLPISSFFGDAFACSVTNHLCNDGIA